MKRNILHLTLLLSFIVSLPFTVSAYYPLSPYCYCSSNPVNCIDPNGEDIVVLNYTEGEHIAMLIQDENGKWQYYSVNGNNVYISGEHRGGRPFNDVAVGSWDSPEQFFNSSYNVNKGKEGKSDKNVNNYDFAEGYQITATPEQDASMRNDFTKIANTEYNLFNNNCATAVQKVMVNAGIPVSKPTMVPTTIPLPTPGGLVDVFNGYQMKCDIKILPSSAFKSIMNWNPSGRYIHK